MRIFSLTSPQKAKAVTTAQGHQGSGGPEFIPINRDWMAFKYDNSSFAGAIGQAQYSTVDTTFNAAMQRWKGEALRSQPFHTIEAVVLPTTRPAESQRSGSGVVYLAD